MYVFTFTRYVINEEAQQIKQLLVCQHTLRRKEILTCKVGNERDRWKSPCKTLPPRTNIFEGNDGNRRRYPSNMGREGEWSDGEVLGASYTLPYVLLWNLLGPCSGRSVQLVWPEAQPLLEASALPVRNVLTFLCMIPQQHAVGK
jgi:hypothetical protein